MNRRTLAVSLLTSAIALQILPTLAGGPPMTGGDFEIAEYTVEATGGTASGGEYAVHASVGPSDAHSRLQSGAFAVEGGFWPGGKGPGDGLFKDGFE